MTQRIILITSNHRHSVNQEDQGSDYVEYFCDFFAFLLNIS
jgi:hypothetical protein